MDFYRILERTNEKKQTIEIYPDFIMCRSKDLMIRGGSFYAIWDESKQLWSTDEYDVHRLVDEDLENYKKENQGSTQYKMVVKHLRNFGSKIWTNYRSYISQMYDTYSTLDVELTFSNTEVTKTDFVSRRLPYPLEKGPCPAYEEIMSTLYSPTEKEKLEWAIGAIISGEAKTIQKFIVLYGEAGTGKSTFLNIVQKLFDGYYSLFDAKSLTTASNSFATEMFKTNPLVAIQHDGDLSKIEDNTKLNSIVSHEEIIVNEKYKSEYSMRPSSFLFMGTNEPVKIKNSKSGIIRRLIDVSPTGVKIPAKKYSALYSQIDFELGAIAYKCLEIYRALGKNYYNSYRPMTMLYQTDMFFNFVEDSYYIFKEQDHTTLSQAYQMYKEYCTSSTINYMLSRPMFRDELKSYFRVFNAVTRIDGKQVRSAYTGFMTEKFDNDDKEESPDEKPYALVLDSDISILDDMLADCPAQYASDREIPIDKWDNCNGVLKDLDTSKIHYVKIPLNHIVIDFDLKDISGNKSAELNLEAASKWPPTYAEFSKGGAGIHLHYLYDGDVTKLSRVYSEGIEVKVFTGNSSLRRRLTKCNNTPVLTINSGLPLKGEKPVINFDSVQSEKGLRDMIQRNLNKEFHPGTKPSIDFIWKIFDDAYKSGLAYDLTDMRPRILSFASNSSHQSEYCVKMVSKMKFTSEVALEATVETYDEDELVFYDVEVFPNLFVVVWKKASGECVKMINPSAKDLEPLFKFKLVGFNCRRYDNHIMYARYIGYDNAQLYALSQKIISNSRNAMFGEAYNLSYTDVYDFASAGNKMSLKKWEIKLGIHHQELGLPWDREVPEDLWAKVAEYCCNDVEATEATFNHLSGDWAARQILAELSGLSVNDTTNQHTIRIVFGSEKKPQSTFVYTDLREMFPGYKFENGKSTYKGIEVGEGGRVYAEPGMYSNTPVLDIVSMHPTSAIQLNIFGPYTKKFEDLVQGRVAIKHKDYDSLKRLLDGKLNRFVEEALGDRPKFTLKDVSNGLKTAINSVYGLTSAGFENPFRDPRNIDNIVAKRGALFMIDLQLAVQDKGYTAAHIKTDSIKIPNATKEIMDFVMELGRKYGYEFEHEETYDRFCLVNDAVYIARSDTEHWTPWGTKSVWTGTGAQFNPETNPYTFKKLFSREPIAFIDMCETKSVTTALYLDMNESLGENEHNYHFVGKVGQFCPIKPGCGGGLLLREKDGKYYAATGSKGYRWLESEMVQKLNREEDIDQDFYNNIVDQAVQDISKHGDFEWFIGEDEAVDDPIGFNDAPPCGNDLTCVECSLNTDCALLEKKTMECGSKPLSERPYENCSDCPLCLVCNWLPF